jgi:hypothetical protein
MKVFINASKTLWFGSKKVPDIVQQVSEPESLHAMKKIKLVFLTKKEQTSVTVEAFIIIKSLKI